MNCPYCNFHFESMISNSQQLPPIAPIICERCAEVGLISHGEIRKATDREVEAIKLSPAWKGIIEPVRAIILKRNKMERAANN